ncbi:TetR/AcrR family transcriptional regulator [Nocardia sp. NPDC056064]|uniref:TetR/AcrR family transcriptional regulator n=1 Tax=Nocardia sp. NPDC056064 TaxID=3345701 RepID=UPI0035DF587D
MLDIEADIERHSRTSGPGDRGPVDDRAVVVQLIAHGGTFRVESTTRILDAALAMAAEGGLAKVSIEGIAERAGVGKRTIYRWWPSKGAVVLDALAQRVEGQQSKSFEAPPDADFPAALRELITDTWVHAVGDQLPVLSWLVGEAQHDPDLAAELRRRLIDPARARVATWIRRAQDQGHIAPDIDPSRVIELVYGQLYYRLLISPGPHDASFADDVADLALRGLRPR